MGETNATDNKPERSITTEDGVKNENLLETFKSDKHGLPLIPQPSEDPMDPLNWKPWIKYLVLGQVSLLSFTALLSASLIVSASPLH